jgi:thioredoxin domain-containing protein 10
MKEGQNFHYHGDRTRDHLVDYAERMSLPPINIVEDKYMMKDIMKNQDTFFLYVGTNSGPVWVSLLKGTAIRQPLILCLSTQEAYNASAHEFQPHVYFYSVTHTILESSGVDSVPPTPSILVYKDRKFHMYQTGDPVALENRLPLESEETTAEPDVVQLHLPGLDDLRHWINHERFPSMVKITPGNFHQVLKTQKYIVIAVLEEDKVGRMSKVMRE